MAEQLEAALVYAARLKWPVFPCVGKVPVIKGGRGCLDATVDLQTIAGWWRDYPAANIGIATGRASGFDVVDVDGEEGEDSLAALVRQHGQLPDTVEQLTGGGGRHLLFRHADGIGNRTAVRPGIDVRGGGGYIIAEPSTHPDSKRRYAWSVDHHPLEAEIAVAPGWLVALISKPAAGPNSGDDFGGVSVEDCLARIRAGTGWHDNMVRLTGHWISRGWSDAEILSIAESVTLAGYSVEQTRREIMQMIAGGRAKWNIPDPEHRSGLAAFAKTEDGVARAFVATHKDDLRFCHHTGKWFVWTGTRWQKEETRLAFSWARKVCRGLNTTAGATLAKASTAAAVERFAQADRAFAVTSAVWDTDPFLLGTPAGVVDLRTGTLRPAERADHITKQTAIAPDFGADRHLWTRFLDEATSGDAELQRFLRQVAGYCLSGDVREHALFFVYGPGGNGKSLFLNVLAGLMSDYATTSAMDSFTASSTDKHPCDLAMLQGARMVSASETEEGRAWAESRIKQLTGGDSIRARFMRQDFFEYRPQFKLVIVGNCKPVLRNVDEAARRRFNIIPFVHKPPVPDLQLEEKLQPEWPAILAWAIEGCLDWQKNGLVRPAVVADATDEYFAEQDIVRRWMEECCETGDRNVCDTTEALFASWSAYAIANGERPGTTKWFGPVLQRLGAEPVADTPGHRKKRGFLRITVKAKDTSGQWQNRMEAEDDALF